MIQEAPAGRKKNKIKKSRTQLGFTFTVQLNIIGERAIPLEIVLN